MEMPKKAYWEAACWIMSYLKGALGKGLVRRPNKHIEFVSYSNANWASTEGDRRFTLGIHVFLW